MPFELESGSRRVLWPASAAGARKSSRPRSTGMRAIAEDPRLVNESSEQRGSPRIGRSTSTMWRTPAGGARSRQDSSMVLLSEKTPVASILQNPDDNAPRWEYARWLRTHESEAARHSAEFIEWQLRLAESFRADPRADLRPQLPDGIFSRREDDPNDIPINRGGGFRELIATTAVSLASVRGALASRPRSCPRKGSSTERSSTAASSSTSP